MKYTNIAIIGCGPRGLAILERLIAFANSLDNASIPYLNIHIFDKNMPGSGCHNPEQDDYLLVNTVASQITHFADDSVQDAGPILPGPSFFEWLRDHENPGSVYDPNGYYSRMQFGKYLNWVFHYLQKRTPRQFKLSLHQNLVDDISPYKENTWQISCDKQSIQDVSFVFLATGHTQKKASAEEISLIEKIKSLRAVNPLLDIIFDPYPIKQNLEKICSKHTIAIEGAGLTAFDIIAELTIGRGGKFIRDEKKYAYIPSGNEPNILLYTRSGLPLTARASNQKGSSGQYKAKFLTLQKVKDTKAATPGGKMDFVAQILPLLLLDMSYAYYSALINKQGGDYQAKKFCDEFVKCKDQQARDELITRHVEAKDQFCWEKLANPIPNHVLCDQQTFQSWLVEFLYEDIELACEGNIDNPVKAACDVLRDLRDTLRYAIDFSALTETSHQWLFREFIPVMNRLAVGPPKERIKELLALMDANIIKFDFGPAAKCTIDDKNAKFTIASTAFTARAATADILIQARIALPGPLDDTSLLMKNLLNRGIVTPFTNGNFHPGGIHVNKNLNIVNKRNEVLSNMWAIGIPTEGCKFYTFVVPRPGVNSTAIVDAGKIVMQMLQSLEVEQSVNLPYLNIKTA